MADNDNENKQPQSVSIEEYNSLKDRFDKLEKIFEERQTKVYDKNNAVSKEVLLKTLGIEKDPQKSEMELVNEKFTTLNKTVEQLQADIKSKDEKLALNEKKQKVRELAKPYNFIDISDVLGVIDYSNEDIEGQLKNIAETKKHWVSSTNLGGSFAGGQGLNKSNLETKLTDAIKNNNPELAISLKRQIYEQNKN